MAMNSTYRALTRAGFNQLNFPRLQDILFLTESEAASIYTARHYRDERTEEFLQEGQYFVLCDAGGGTVDVVSYQVKKLHPILELEQVGHPTGLQCLAAAGKAISHKNPSQYSRSRVRFARFGFGNLH